MKKTRRAEKSFLTSREVADLFGVGLDSLNRWEKEGYLSLTGYLTPRGHRRFWKEDVMNELNRVRRQGFVRKGKS